MFNYFNYSFFYSYFYDYAYIIAFAQFALGMAGLITINKRFYNILILYGVILTYTAIYSSPQFDQQPSSYDIQAVYANSMFYVFLVSYFVYHRSIRLREDAHRQELVFADIGKKLSIVLHELQGSLRNIESSSFSPDASKDLQDIQEISRLINVLTSSSQAPQAWPFNISTLVKETLDLNKELFAYYDINITTSLIDEEIVNDQLAFKIILKNIIKNAIEAVVELPVNQRQIDIQMTKSTKLNEYQLVVQNSFNGKLKNLSEIKKPFVTTKTNITNRGLGLYIMEILAQSSHIKLNLHAENNKFSVCMNFKKSAWFFLELLKK